MKDYFDRLYLGSKEAYFKKIEKNLIDNKKTFVITANPEAFMLGKNNKDYHRILMDKKVSVIADGIGLVKAGKRIGYKIEERIPGIELATWLLECADKNKKKVYLFGSKANVIKDMKSLIKRRYKGIKLVGAENGYVQDKEVVFEDMIKKAPDVVLVALGMPLQEQLIYKFYDKFENGIFVGVGGSFDVISGNKKRAPKLFQKLNIEWLYRIIREPKRIKRFYNNNVKFLFEIKKKKDI